VSRTHKLTHNAIQFEGTEWTILTPWTLKSRRQAWSETKWGSRGRRFESFRPDHCPEHEKPL
jgi:hypothetical protein